MNEDLTWEVRYEAAERESRQKALAKACFYWKKDGQLLRSAEFTQSELEVECERLCEIGADLTQFVLALKQLALSTGQAERGAVAFVGVDQRRM
jgi:hypothetical protein